MIIGLNIAGIPIGIQTQTSLKIKRKVHCFLTSPSQDVDIRISIKKQRIITLPEDCVSYDDKMHWKYINGTNTELYIYDPDTNQVMYRLSVNNQWNKAEITYTKNDDTIMAPFLGSLGEILFRNRILYYQGLVIHAAAIEWKGKGIMFTAPSGTGKTTQANLWRKYKKAQIINADRPAIRVINHEPYVYGTLWNGSSNRCTDKRVPLSAIVIIEQAVDNNIQRIRGKEAISKLMPRCFLPYHMEDLMNLALDNLEKIIAVTPVYLLACKPDSEAVELVYQCVR